jgi:hypothetical protein
MEGANELFIYDLFRNILKASTVMEGRFHVLKGNGIDANSSNFGDIVKDELDGLKLTKKYPVAILQPVTEFQTIDDRGWSAYRLHMYFLTLDKRTSDGDIKGVDVITNTSEHTMLQDWKDMREVAGNFRKKLREVLKACTVLQETGKSVDTYSRLSYKGNARLNGVYLTFELRLWDGYNCNPLADYPSDTEIVIPTYNTHPLHKH